MASGRLTAMEQHDLEFALEKIIEQLMDDCGLSGMQTEHVLVHAIQRIMKRK